MVRRARGDAALVTGVSDVRYLSGFTGDDSWLLADMTGDTYLITDSRYTEQAIAEAPQVHVVQRREPLAHCATKLMKRFGFGRVAFDPDTLTVRFHTALTERLPRVEFTPQIGLVAELRQVKDATEIALIREALRSAEEAVRRLTPEIRPGMTERQIANRLEVHLRDAGAEKAAFDTIVAFSERASLAHARPTDRVLEAGEPILIDWGASRRLYCSDLTRVLVPAKMKRFLRDIHEIVLEAQRRAIRRIRPGARLRDIDAAARDYITRKGYGRHFGHGLGHGLGLDVHELPHVNWLTATRAEPGMVFTVEPGIYLAGKGGVRIEDVALVTRSGCEILSHLEKELV